MDHEVGAMPSARATGPSDLSPASGSSQSSVPIAEFCARFKARMLDRAGPKFDDGESIADYADETSPSYWEDCFDETPEGCADADMSYWGEE